MDGHLHLPLQPMESVASDEAALSENGLCDRFADAKPGEAITYHTGMLARDRDKLATTLPPSSATSWNWSPSVPGPWPKLGSVISCSGASAPSALPMS
jgi:hypothetical protein